MRASEAIAAEDGAPFTVHLLVDDRPSQADVATGDVQHQLASGIQPEAVSALKAERNPVQVGSGRDDEVVLETPLIAVVDQIDSGVDLAIVDPRVGGNPGAL